MKRDMDLIRKILVGMEGLEESPTSTGEFQVEGFTDGQVNYHLRLLVEAGLIVAADAGDEWIPLYLTWQGHEFIDASREDSRWEKAKSVVMAKTGGLSFELIKDVLLKWGSAAIMGSM